MEGRKQINLRIGTLKVIALSLQYGRSALQRQIAVADEVVHQAEDQLVAAEVSRRDGRFELRQPASKRRSNSGSRLSMSARMP